MKEINSIVRDTKLIDYVNNLLNTSEEMQRFKISPTIYNEMADRDTRAFSNFHDDLNNIGLKVVQRALDTIKNDENLFVENQKVLTDIIDLDMDVFNSGRSHICKYLKKALSFTIIRPRISLTYHNNDMESMYITCRDTVIIYSYNNIDIVNRDNQISIILSDSIEQTKNYNIQSIGLIRYIPKGCIYNKQLEQLIDSNSSKIKEYESIIAQLKEKSETARSILQFMNNTGINTGHFSSIKTDMVMSKIEDYISDNEDEAGFKTEVDEIISLNL